jgi:hypothetical protein
MVLEIIVTIGCFALAGFLWYGRCVLKKQRESGAGKIR